GGQDAGEGEREADLQVEAIEIAVHRHIPHGFCFWIHSTAASRAESLPSRSCRRVRGGGGSWAGGGGRGGFFPARPPGSRRWKRSSRPPARPGVRERVRGGGR